jgi:Family of unknown function (DUF5681)
MNCKSAPLITTTALLRRRTGGGTGEGAVRGGEAHRFKPGQSGNPGGRPKTGALTRAFRAVLEQPVPGDRRKRSYAQAIAERIVDFAMRGQGRTVPCVQLTDLAVEDETPGPARADSSKSETSTEPLQARKTTNGKIEHD